MESNWPPMNADERRFVYLRLGTKLAFLLL